MSSSDPIPSWRRPGTLAELRAALDAFPGWDAVERARRAPELIEAAKTVLAGERGAAMAEATATGLGATVLARMLGVSRAKVYAGLARAGTASTTGRAGAGSRPGEVTGP